MLVTGKCWITLFCVLLIQSLCQRSKTRTNLTDSGSASRATFQCMQFLSIFSYLSYLGHPSFLGLQRPEDRATLLLSSCSSLITRRCSWALRWTVLCMLFASAHKKCPVQKVGHLGSLGPIPMIQPPVCSSCVALQYETEIERFRNYATSKIRKISAQPCGLCVRFLHVYEVSDDFCWKYLIDECSLYLTEGLKQWHHHPEV